MAAKPAPKPFTGFPKEAPQFFHELAIEMNRDWFIANKARYEALWVQPMQALLAAVQPKLAVGYAPIKLGAPKVMRIHRDVRFSKDKTPYKTHIGASLSTAKHDYTALYIHLGMDEEFVGSGCYYFEPDQLARWRKLVAGKPGVELGKLRDKLRKAGYQIRGFDDYKRVPKPYPQDHPRAELLRLKGLTGGMPPIPRGLLHDRELVRWIVTHGKALAPLVRWLDQHVR